MSMKRIANIHELTSFLATLVFSVEQAVGIARHFFEVLFSCKKATAVNVDCLTGDEFGFRLAEKLNCSAYIFRLSHKADRGNDAGGFTSRRCAFTPILPGATTFTAMPSAANSVARQCIMPTEPILPAETWQRSL